MRDDECRAVASKSDDERKSVASLSGEERKTERKALASVSDEILGLPRSSGHRRLPVARPACQQARPRSR